MKKLNLSLAIFALAAMSVNAQTAYSDPVGYQTITIAGGGTTAAPKYTMLAVNLANPTVYQATMGSDFSGTFAAGAYNAGSTYAKYYLEIVSTGARVDIVSNSASNLVLGSADQSSISAALSTPKSVRIRKHRVLSDLFGGALATTTDSTVPFLKGTSASAADSVLVMIDGAYKTLYYSSSPTKPGWRDGSTLATEFPIYPSDGIFIARKATAPLSITISGEVKNYTSLIPIAAGVSAANPKYTLTTLPVPVAVTLPTLFGGDGTSGGGTSLKLVKGASASAADNVLIWNGTSFNTYFYSSSPTKPGWRDASGNVASAVSIPSDASFLIKRTSVAATVSYTANF